MTNSRAQKIQTAIKTADTSITSDSTFNNDTELFLPLKVSKVYSFIMTLFIDSVTAADFKFQFAVPSGTTGWRNNGAFSINPSVTAAIAADSGQLTTDANEQILVIHGVFKTSTTAGNLQLTWAQFASDGGATVVSEGSSLILIS